MGQYYHILNLDKKEYLSPYDFGCTAKLMEFSYIAKDLQTNSFLSTAIALMRTEWQNDRVVVVGDYADYAWATDEPKNQDDKFFLRALSTEPGFEFIAKKRNDPNNPDYHSYNTLYDADEWGFTERTDYTNVHVPPYLCNRHTKEYVELTSLPLEWKANNQDGDENYISIFPFPLLLAVGNGLGGGDYRGANKNYVGAWTLTADGVYFSDTIPTGYMEYPVVFSENL